MSSEEEKVAVTSLLIARYGSSINIEFGPGRIGEVNRRSHATFGLNPSADYFCDWYGDLEHGIPVCDGVVDSLYSNQFLEHIKDQIFLWNEMWRVLRPGGKMHHIVPRFPLPNSIADPTHVHYFCEESFRYYSARPDGRPYTESFSDYGIVCAFIIDKISLLDDDTSIGVWMHKPGAV